MSNVIFRDDWPPTNLDALAHLVAGADSFVRGAADVDYGSLHRHELEQTLQWIAADPTTRLGQFVSAAVDALAVGAMRVALDTGIPPGDTDAALDFLDHVKQTLINMNERAADPPTE